MLAFSTALAGGIIRDLLIGDVPPASLRDWRYAAIAFAGGTVAFVSYRAVQGIPPNFMMVLDAAGLSLCAVAGTEKALLHKMHPFIAVLLGTITAVGGGTLRDMFLAQVPTVLRADVYATAALAGALILIAARRVGIAPRMAAVLGGVACFALRVVSVFLHWNLPKFAAH